MLFGFSWIEWSTDTKKIPSSKYWIPNDENDGKPQGAKQRADNFVDYLTREIGKNGELIGTPESKEMGEQFYALFITAASSISLVAASSAFLVVMGFEKTTSQKFG